MLKVKTDEERVKVELSGNILDNLTDTELTIKYLATTIKKRCRKDACMELYNVWLGDTIDTLLDV